MSGPTDWSRWHCRPDEPGIDDVETAPPTPGGAIPGSKDFRDEWGRQAVLQRTGDDCTSVALAGAVEFLEWKRTGLPVELSSAFLHYNANRIFADDDPRISITSGIRVLREIGVCSLMSWPYERDWELQRLPPGETLSGLQREAGAHRIGTFHVERDAGRLRGWLASDHPIVFNFFQYTPSFWDWDVTSSGTLPIPEPGEVGVNKHTVLAVGYDREKGFLIRNSEGPRWKLEGHFWMPDEFIRNPESAGPEFYVITSLAP